jgi:predicted phage tail protein
VPGGLASHGITASTATIDWAASSDDHGVARYEVEWSPGTTWQHFSWETITTLTMRGMTPNGLYRFRVRALDAAGNASAWSSVISVRLLPDRLRPTRPGSPRFGSITASSTVIAWRASRDNVQVRRYVVSQRVGRRWVVVARPVRARVRIVRLPAHHAVTFRVQAVDTAGNRSFGSLAATVRLR